MFGGSTLWKSISERWKLRETLSNVPVLHLQRRSLRSKEARRKLRSRKKNVRNVGDARKKKTHTKNSRSTAPQIQWKTFYQLETLLKFFWLQSNRLLDGKRIMLHLPSKSFRLSLSTRSYVEPKRNICTCFPF